MTAAALSGSINPLAQGFLLCASIIVAFGPQNLFILRQGLRKHHLFATALFSTLADIVLITVGVGGLSALISTSSIIHTLISVAGVAFLSWCGVRALINAWHPASSTVVQTTPQAASKSLQATILITLSFSFLNPSAYVDTLMIIGSKSLLFASDQRIVFAAGAVLASTFWFFALTYGASKLSLIFRSQIAWRVLDVASGCIMLGIAMTILAASSGLA